MQTKHYFKKSDITDTINIVFLTGSLEGTPTYSHKYDEVSYYSARVKINRTSGNKFDVIHVFIPEDAIAQDVLLDAGVRVEIQGYVVQSELHGMNDVSVVAQSIKLATEGSKDENVLCIGGVVHRSFELRNIKDTEKVVKSIILKHTRSIEEKSYGLTIKVSCWNNTAKLVDNKYKEGDKIVVRGQLESKLVKPSKLPEEKKVAIVLHEATAAAVLDIPQS